MENFCKSFLEFENIELNNLLIDLRNNFDNKQDNFACICRSVYKIWDYCKNKYFKAKDNEYYNSYKLLAKFGFDKMSVFRLKSCYERFVDDFHNKKNLPFGAEKHCRVCLKNEFERFSHSKLFELLVLSEEEVYDYLGKGLIKPSMTVKEIRTFIKSIKGKTSEDEESEEDIPFAFDPKQVYEFQYFNGLSKNQLVNIAMSYQNYIHKAKNG